MPPPMTKNHLKKSEPSGCNFDVEIIIKAFVPDFISGAKVS